MIVLCAPYSPVGETLTPNLGAASKIEQVIAALYAIDSKITLVNSAHNGESLSPMISRYRDIGNIGLTEIIPATIRSRKIGKLLNLLSIDDVFDCIAARDGVDLVWIYNGYAFECLFAREAIKRWNCRLVLQLEDWPTSRRRGLSIKPQIDSLCLRCIVSKINLSVCVNSTVAAKIQKQGCSRTFLLPGMVPQNLVHACEALLPFRRSDHVSVGYFGGLNNEKGAHNLLSLLNDAQFDGDLLVCGSGPLESEFRHAASHSNGRLRFFSGLDSQQLYQKMSACDVLLNPHSDIRKMSNGVLPFKAIEAVASGRVFISTWLPTEGLAEVFAATIFYDGSHVGLLSALASARAHYKKNRDRIESSAREAREQYCGPKLTRIVQGFLSSREARHT